MLHGRRFTLLADHKPLLSIFSSKIGIPGHLASRFQRMAVILLGYDFEFRYCRTQDFGQADRHPPHPKICYRIHGDHRCYRRRRRSSSTLERYPKSPCPANSRPLG
ncbi:unnamed protein product [Dicrocoelium dendriticum]|nr:unnamed protein product [Dicrocoelium dendriticum]